MLPFWLSIGVLSLVQAALVAAPRPAEGRLLKRLGQRLERLGGRWWALVMPLSIGVVLTSGPVGAPWPTSFRSAESEPLTVERSSLRSSGWLARQSSSSFTLAGPCLP